MGLGPQLKEIFIRTKNIEGYIQNEMFLFPEATNITCTFIAGGANAWGAWAQIQDSNALLFSTRFATRSGFLAECALSNFSADLNRYMFEIGWGAVPTIVARGMCISATAATGPLPYFVDLRSAQIPRGELIYYRMMCETGGANCQVGFRYYFMVL
jgi:hypothetical protein